ncbi:MAG TPA: hypothetical protein ENK19_10465 [Acidobacteria bacterium]|nr:hypothetical protein [Acidobacteriota bacterium]
MTDAHTSSAKAFAAMRDFLMLGDEDAARLKAFLPRIEDRLPGITDAFYARLLEEPATARYLEGRLDRLKTTHLAWLKALFSGEYGSSFFERQFVVGQVHVKVELDSLWVDTVMSLLRSDLNVAILERAENIDEAKAVYGSLLKVMDAALMIINLAYNEHRLDLIHQVTGMPRALLERLVQVGIGTPKP